MKAKKLMGMIACAGACVSLSAFGNTTNGWFGVTVGTDTGITPVNCKTNGVAVTVADNKIVLDNDMASPLTITPDASFTATNMNDGVYVIKATAVLTPCSASDLDSNITEGAKAGFAVGIDNNVTNYYGYAKEGWTPYPDVPVVNEGLDTTFKIVLNYRDSKVQFYAGDDAATYLGEGTLASGTSAPIGIDAFGSGSISSITSGYEVAVAAYGDKKYGSIAEAVTAAKKDSHDATSVRAVTDSGDLLPANETASNGLNLVLCEAMGLPTDKTTDEATIKLESATTSHANAITLAWKKPPTAEADVEIQFKVKKGEKEYGPYNWNDIQIPMESGTYTIEPSIQ